LLSSQERLDVDDAAITEAVFALDKGLGLARLTIQGFVEAVLAQPVAANRTLWNRVFDIWTSHPKLSVVDVYLAVKARINECGPVYTFDLKMINQLDGTAPVPLSPSPLAD